MELERRPLLWALLVALLVVCELGVVILAHVVANGIVAFWAVATGDWTII
jgi:hypothetical protein